jgi:uncharacterized protein YkwD
MTSARIPGFLKVVSLGGAVAALAALVALLGLPQTTAHAGKSYRWNRPERCFMKKINEVRADNGLRKLQKDMHLGYVAKRHARRMASKETMWEQGDLGNKITKWRTLGQNTGLGGKCSGLFQAFMDSAPHAANILGEYKFMGVGAKWRNNRLYVQQIFEWKRNPGNVYHTP